MLYKTYALRGLLEETCIVKPIRSENAHKCAKTIDVGIPTNARNTHAKYLSSQGGRENIETCMYKSQN